MSTPFPAVTIQFRHAGKCQNITSVEQAAELLLMDWPIHDGTHLKVARQKCLDALDQLTTVTDARAAFIEAAREANIFVDYRSATI